VAAVVLDAQILTMSDEVAWERPFQLPPEAFDVRRSAPFELPLPLEGLRRGAHLLSVTSTLAGGTKVRTETVFRVR
jgi:hypothetical protein